MAMRRIPRRLTLTILAVSLLLARTGSAQVTVWEYAALADSAGEFDDFSVPAINDGGQVAFVATPDNPAEAQVLYRAEANGNLTVIADTSGPVQEFFGAPSINASGLVAVTAGMDDGSVSVLAGDGGALVTVANTVTDALTNLSGSPFVGDTGGEVVVWAVRAADGAGLVLKGTGALPPAVLVDGAGAYNPESVAGINEDGVVAFKAFTAGRTVRGVYRTSDGVTVTPVVETGPDAGDPLDVQALDINNNGTVVFQQQTAASTSLNVETTGTPVLFADTTGPFAEFGAAAVAESGATAFRGVFDEGLDAIFAGGTGLYEKAIAVGDGLLGSGVTGLESGPEAVTRAGIFVFRAERGDGTRGVFLARPRVDDGDGGGGGGGALDGFSLSMLLGLWAWRTRRRGQRPAGGAGDDLPGEDPSP